MCCGGKTRVLTISLFTHLQLCRHQIIMTAMDKLSSISRDNVSSINQRIEEQRHGEYFGVQSSWPWLASHQRLQHDDSKHLFDILSLLVTNEKSSSWSKADTAGPFIFKVLRNTAQMRTSPFLYDPKVSVSKIGPIQTSRRHAEFDFDDPGNKVSVSSPIMPCPHGIRPQGSEDSLQEARLEYFAHSVCLKPNPDRNCTVGFITH
jgi:hypothetical protein